MTSRPPPPPLVHPPAPSSASRPSSVPSAPRLSHRPPSSSAPRPPPTPASDLELELGRRHLRKFSAPVHACGLSVRAREGGSRAEEGRRRACGSKNDNARKLSRTPEFAYGSFPSTMAPKTPRELKPIRPKSKPSRTGPIVSKSVPVRDTQDGAKVFINSMLPRRRRFRLIDLESDAEAEEDAMLVVDEKLPLEEENLKLNMNMDIQHPEEINDEALQREGQRNRRWWRLRSLRREARKMERLIEIEMEKGRKIQMFEESLKERYREREEDLLKDLMAEIQTLRERLRQLDLEMDMDMEIERLSDMESSKLGEREWDSEWEWELEFESQTMMSDERLPLRRLYCKTSSRLKHLQKQDRFLDLIRQRVKGLSKLQSKKKKKKKRMEKKVNWIMASMHAEPDYTLQEKAMRALHILNCKKIAERDPRKKALVLTRVTKFNLAFFDLDEESKAVDWPLFRDLPVRRRGDLAASSLNVISLKVVESCVGYPIEVYGTVLARDSIDFKCVYLFKRERDDPQKILSEDDMLTLTGPHRGFVITDLIFFEVNLKIKNAPQIPDEDFSKGLIGYRGCVVHKQPMARVLTSWWSKVELVYTHLADPVEATLAVKILKGHAPFKGKVTAWTGGNASNNENHIILYDSTSRRTWAEVEGSDEDGVSIALSRNLVAVPVPVIYMDDCEMELSVCFDTDGNFEVTTLRCSMEEEVCKVGFYELQVKVTWRAILSEPFTEELTEVFNRKRWRYVPNESFKSWLWMVYNDH